VTSPDRRTARISALPAPLLRFALALALLAPAGARALDVAGTCTIKFFGSSSLHDFEGDAPCMLSIDGPDAAGRFGARAEVEIAGMRTGIAARDKRMRQMFEAKKFPRITATFASVDPDALRAAAPGALPFRIAIHGVERDVAPALSGFAEVPGRSARFRASFTLALSDFGMEAPVAMGFIRVEDRVKVDVEVALTARNGAGAPAPR
jgi:hypothetical protein